MRKNWIPFLARGAAWLFFFGLGLLLLTLLAFAATAIYEWISPPTDMHLAGLLTAVLMFHVAPVGAVLFASGGLAWIGLTLAQRRNPKKNTGRD